LFKLKGRNVIFLGDGGNYNVRLLILKEKISDKVLEVFILFLLIFNIIIILFIFYISQEDKIRG
jgi:predicted permease